MQRSLIVISDCSDVAISEILLTLQNDLLPGIIQTIRIEPVVQVAPFSILNGAFLVRLIAEVAPPNSILFVILNPITGQPPRLIGKSGRKNLVFLGRDTGVFGWFLKDFGCEDLYYLHEQKFVPFGGKNIYPSVLARFLNGEELSSLGSVQDSRTPNHIEIEEGSIVHIDNFGLAKFYCEKRPWTALREGTKIELSKNGNPLCEAVVCERMMDYPDGTITVYRGSSLNGLPEVGKVRGNAAKDLGFKIGEIIALREL